MSTHDKIVSLLTQWDTKQAKRDKHHNRQFLGIALASLAWAEEDYPGADAKEVVRAAFNGRCAAFILNGLGIAFTPDEIA